MREMLDQKLARFEFLEAQMTDPAVLSDSNKIAAIAREHGGMVRFATKYRRFRSVIAQIAQVRPMANSSDADERALAEEELASLIAEREKLWNEILEQTVGGEEASRARCFMEIRAGVGGDEAAIFAGDLYRMYKRHAEIKGWKVEVIDLSEAELGGFKEVILAFEGDGVFRELQYESGGHRVPRQPPSPCCPNRKMWKLNSSPTTIAKMCFARAVPADSTSTRPRRLCDCRTTKQESSSRCKTKRVSTRTLLKRCAL
jgi:peptide chain release factor 1